MTQTPDAELVAQVRGGSHDAMAELFRRYLTPTWQAAYGLCGRRALADDMTQDAFERAFAALPEFNGRSSFGTWVQRIAINRTIDHLRREKRTNELPDDLEDPVEWAAAIHADAHLVKAVARLSPERRAAIVLRYWLDYTPAEIAEALGLPPGTVASRLSRALDELRKALEDDNA